MHFDDGLVDGLELPSGSSASRPLIACRCRPLLRRRVGGPRARADPVAVDDARAASAVELYLLGLAQTSDWRTARTADWPSLQFCGLRRLGASTVASPMCDDRSD